MAENIFLRPDVMAYSKRYPTTPQRNMFAMYLQNEMQVRALNRLSSQLSEEDFDAFRAFAQDPTLTEADIMEWYRVHDVDTDALTEGIVDEVFADLAANPGIWDDNIQAMAEEEDRAGWEGRNIGKSIAFDYLPLFPEDPPADEELALLLYTIYDRFSFALGRKGGVPETDLPELTDLLYLGLLQFDGWLSANWKKNYQSDRAVRHLMNFGSAEAGLEQVIIPIWLKQHGGDMLIDDVDQCEADIRAQFAEDREAMFTRIRNYLAEHEFVLNHGTVEALMA